MNKAMIRLFFLVTAVLLLQAAVAQRAAPDEIETRDGVLSIQPILHGTVVFTWNDKTIYVDPFGGAAAFEGIRAPDMILITDIHGDHMNAETLGAIVATEAILVVPKAVAEALGENLAGNRVIIGNGDSTSQLGVGIRAVPMYNLPETADSRHPKGRGNGYVLTFAGRNVYISGDTEDIPEMRELRNIDVAFVCMNGPTMDVNQAASAVLDFKPAIVYPFHHRGSDIEMFKQLVNAGNTAIEVRIRNWYPKYE